MKYRLGDGWDGDLTVGEGNGGEKYADLSIYCGEERILGLAIDHYDIHMDSSDLSEMLPKLREMIRRLNEKEWFDSIPTETLARDLKTKAETRMMKGLGVSLEIAHKLVANGIHCLAACEGTEAKDYLAMGFSVEETLSIVDGMRKANV